MPLSENLKLTLLALDERKEKDKVSKVWPVSQILPVVWDSLCKEHLIRTQPPWVIYVFHDCNNGRVD